MMLDVRKCQPKRADFARPAVPPFHGTNRDARGFQGGTNHYTVAMPERPLLHDQY